MSVNDMHWDPVAQRMRPGLAIYKSDIENKIREMEKMLPTIDVRLVASAQEQIATWKSLLASLAHIDSNA